MEGMGGGAGRRAAPCHNVCEHTAQDGQRRGGDSAAARHAVVTFSSVLFQTQFDFNSLKKLKIINFNISSALIFWFVYEMIEISVFLLLLLKVK